MPQRLHRVVALPTGLPGLTAFHLATAHHFPRHSHDQYGVGVILQGGHRSWSGIGPVEAGPGDLIGVNPGEVHDGAPAGGATRSWRMLYFDPPLLAAAADERGPDQPELIRPAFRDPSLRRCLGHVFAQVQAGAADALALEEALALLLEPLLRRHATRPGPRPEAHPCVARVRERIDAEPQAKLTLKQLAAIAGVGRFALLRGFRRALGTTPHAYQLAARVRLARRLLIQGLAPAEAAADAGFADQSHLTRAFARQFATTPGAFRNALG